MRLVEDATRQSTKMIDIALVPDRKTAHRNAIDLFDAFRAFVLPGHVISRSRRDDLDLGVTGEPFGDVSCVELRAAVDIRAIALDRDRDLHDSEGSPSGSRCTGVRPRSFEYPLSGAFRGSSSTGVRPRSSEYVLGVRPRSGDCSLTGAAVSARGRPLDSPGSVPARGK